MKTDSNVIQFPKLRQEFEATVAVPPDVEPSDVFTLRVRGTSLSDLDVRDGDLLICVRSVGAITDESVYAVYIRSTGELLAKRVIPHEHSLILRSVGGGIPDREESIDDVEIRGIAIASQRPLAA